MSFKIKVDEDLPAAITRMLKAGDYDAVSVLEQNRGGLKDPPLWQAVQAEGRFLITADKGFGDIRSCPPGAHAGVLVLRPDEDGVRPMEELIEKVLAQYQLAELAGTIAVVTPRGIRIRRPPVTDEETLENGESSE